MPRRCSIAGCEGRHFGRDFCQRHYGRWHRYGNPLAATALTGRGEPLKFVEAALRSDLDDCIDWPFAKSGAGYGRLSHLTRMVYANRLVCELAHGKPPSKRHQAAHSCGNTRCVNPRHLGWKTAKENADDKVAHGTVRQGEACHQAKLTSSQVREIRAKQGRQTAKRIAAEYGVTRQTINRIHSGHIWRQVAPETVEA